MKVTWGDEAEQELYFQVRHIARDRPSSAEMVLETLLEAAARLGDFPEMGVAGRRPDTRELIVPHLPYIIVYWRLTSCVEVLGLIHTARDR